MKRLTIYDIKRRLEESGDNPHFFTRRSMKFFGQTLKSFSVTKDEEKQKYFISAPTKVRGCYTERWFNPITNRLEHT